MDSSVPGQDVLDQLAEEFIRRHRQGEHPSLSDYVEAYPDFAEEIRELFPALVVMEQLAPDDANLIPDNRKTSSESTPQSRELGDYRLLAEIGRGGMGIVYEAEQLTLGRRVALKVLNAHYSQGERALIRFVREARSAARLHHTNIVPVFEVGHHEDVCYYAMQLIPGQGLDEVWQELRRFHKGEIKDGKSNQIAHSVWTGNFHVPAAQMKSPSPTPGNKPGERGASTEAECRIPPAKADAVEAVAEPVVEKTSASLSATRPESSAISANPRQYYHNVARIGRDVADALAYAHARKVIHRDVKPSNLLLDAAGTVWITDFGLAKTEDEGLTQSGEIVGTLMYMSPERFRGTCDARADVYALGVTLYELLAFKPAFVGTDRLTLIDKILHEQPRRLRALNPNVPLDLETIVLKAMEKEPNLRYKSAEDLAADLQRFLNDQPIKARKTSALERLSRWGRRHPGVACLATLVFLLVAAIAVVSTHSALTLVAERDRTQKETRKRQVERVKTLVSASAEGVPVVIDELSTAPQGVLPLLREQFHDSRKPQQERFRLAIALTILGESKTKLLAACAPDLRANECNNLVLALRKDPQAPSILLRNFKRAQNRKSRFRYAVVLLELGYPEPAWQLLALGPDPADRIYFIHQFDRWHADLSAIPRILREADPDFRSGLCAAVARLDPASLPGSTRSDLEKTFADLYVTAKGGGTHSICKWALQHWNVPLPKIEKTSLATNGRSWFVNNAGVDMMVIQPGANQVTVRKAQLPFRLTKSLCISACEIPISVFCQFLDDPGYPAELKPADFPRMKLVEGKDSKIPIHHASFEDSVLFCNWLSSKDGRQPSYLRDKSKPNQWICHYQRDGYRLLTSWEWEYACRSGTTTRFPFGDDEDLYPEYTNAVSSTPLPGGTFLPNTWGFFDTLGNRWDLCLHPPGQNLNNPTSVYLTKSVHVQSQGFGTIRGGTAGTGIYFCNPGSQFTSSLPERTADRTFRVACGNWQGELNDSKDAQSDLLDLVNKAIANEPANVSYRMKRAAHYSALGNWARANEDWSEIIRHHPKDAALLTKRAAFHTWHGKWKEAADDYLKVVMLNPDNPYPSCRAIPILLTLGDRKGYESLCKVLLERFGDTKEATIAERIAKACALVPTDAGRLKQAARLAEFAVSRAPNNNFNRLAKGMVLYRQKEWEKALHWLDHQRDNSTAQPNAYVSAKAVQAMAHFRLKQFNQASRALAEAAVELNKTTKIDAGTVHYFLMAKLLYQEAVALIQP